MSLLCNVFRSCANLSNRIAVRNSKALVVNPRVCYSSGNKGKGSGQDDDPLDPCYCERCCISHPCPSGTTLYDVRKYGHSLPTNSVSMYFDPLPNMPTGIFRCIDGEILGLGAGKCCVYKVPEYFAYHHMSFFDMHLLMRCYRLPTPKTGRKP